MNVLSALAIAAIVGALLLTVWRRILLSLTLSLAILIVFALTYASSNVPSLGPPIFKDLVWVVQGTEILSPPWTLVTTIFVHNGLFHLMFNLLGFFLITPILEERIGSLRWAIVFFAGSLFGQLLYWMLHLGEPFILVGASGGLLAVLGAFGRLYPRERITLFLPFLFLPAVPVIWVVVGYLFLSFVLAATPGTVAHEAHIGGIVLGFVAAPLVMRIPAARTRVRTVRVNTAALEPLATTRELRAILDELRAADVPEVQAAWSDKFVQQARCPACGGPIRDRRGTLVSPCGWRLRP